MKWQSQEMGELANRIGAVRGFWGDAEDKLPFAHGKFGLSSGHPRRDIQEEISNKKFDVSTWSAGETKYGSL